MRLTTWWLLPTLLTSSCLLPDPDPSGAVWSPSATPGPPTATPDASPPQKPILRAARSIPAIQGGTLAVGGAGAASIAVASEPETDTIWILRKDTPLPVGRVALEQGAEPGRVALGPGKAFVALRRAGQIAEVDLGSAQLAARHDVCPAPRGLDIDAQADLLAVACAGGELLFLRASTMEKLAGYQLERDLRDVVIRGEEILISRFRSSELLVVLKDGSVRDRAPPPDTSAPPGLAPKNGDRMTASVAWRMIPTRDGGAAVVHQTGFTGNLAGTASGPVPYYGSQNSPCRSILRSTLSTVREGRITSSPGFQAALVVDVAERSQEFLVAVASGPPEGPPNSSAIASPCDAGVQPRPLLFNGTGTSLSSPSTGNIRVVSGTAVAIDDGGTDLVQQTSPRGVTWGNTFHPFTDAIAADGLRDTGRELFHQDTGVGIACASCHPEGGDDGRVWNFQQSGRRRTQPLQGGLKGSEPFHWSGDLSSFPDLMSDVFVRRMSGPQTSPEQSNAVLDWLDTIPAMPAARVDASAFERGRALFESPGTGCTSCHNGPRHAGNQSVNVGTGEALQIPPLQGLVYRAPYMHDGCAPTLADRFGACGGGDAHGATSQLSQEQLADLIAFLEGL